MGETIGLTLRGERRDYANLFRTTRTDDNARCRRFMSSSKQAAWIHPNALCESPDVGTGTRVWAFAHVMRGATVGEDCNIGEGAFIEAGARVGSRVTLKNHVLVWEGVSIADDVFVGPNVCFTNDRRPRSPRMEAAAARYAKKEHWLVPTSVERGASLGASAVVLPGVTIGAYALVAAGAVVCSDVAAHRLVMGNPARAVGWVCHCGQKVDFTLPCAACGRLIDLSN